MSVARPDGARFSTSVAITLGAKIAGAAIALVTSVIVARSLGPEGRGAFAAVIALAGIGMSFATLGLQSSNAYYLSRDRGLLDPIIANAMIVAMVVGTMAALLLGVVAIASGLVDSAGPWAITIGLVGVPVGLAYTLLVNLLVPLGAVNRFNQVELGHKLITLALLLGLVVAVQSATPAALLAATLVAQVIILLFVAVSVGANTGTLGRHDAALLRTQVPFAFRAYLASTLAFLMMRSDMLLVQHLAGNAEAGNYAIAVSMADLVYMLPATVAALLFPRLSANADGTARRRITWRLTFAVGAGMACIGSALALIAGPLISLLFGTGFAPAAAMFQILAVAIVLNGMNAILSCHLAAEQFPWGAVWVWMVGLFINASVNWMVVPHHGGRGAAFASAVAYAVVLGIQAWLVLRSRSDTR